MILKKLVGEMMANSRKNSRRTIREKLFKGRVVHLEGPMIEDYMVYFLTGPRAMKDALLYLDAQNHDPIKMIINSPGGYVSEGFSLFDVMQTVKSPIWTICLGQAASIAAIILAGGQKGNRYIFPRSNTLLHLPSGRIMGDARDIEIQSRHMQAIKDQMVDILLEHTNQKDRIKIEQDIDRDKYMNAKQTVEYGLADHIVKSIKELKILNEKTTKRPQQRKQAGVLLFCYLESIINLLDHYIFYKYDL